MDKSAAPASRKLRLSEEIDGILAVLTEHPIRLRELIAAMQGRAYMLLLILISLPFCLPIPLPGLSTFFGTIIALIGLRLALRQEPWLPERMLETKLSPKTLLPVLTGARRVATSFEALLRPRWSFLVEWPLLHHLNGAMIAISGFLLLLPLPVPFSNILPAITIICLAAAMLERDGYFVILGVIFFIITVIFFGGIFLGGKEVVSWITNYFSQVPPGD